MLLLNGDHKRAVVPRGRPERQRLHLGFGSEMVLLPGSPICSSRRWEQQHLRGGGNLSRQREMLRDVAAPAMRHGIAD
jgi:hypothetical protein